MNRKKTAIVILLAMVTIVNIQFADAGSIYGNRSSSISSATADDTANEVGDILTILISEVSEIESKLKSKLESSSSRSAAWDGKVGIDHSMLPISPDLPTFKVADGTSSDRKRNGKVEYKNESEITDRVSVIVEDVHPNGNLVIIGKIQRKVAGDMQTIDVSGIVRPSDIKYDNTIKSEQIANFYMVIKNDGPSETYSKVGWLGQILDFIWPF